MLTALAMPALLCWAFAQAPSATPRWEPGLIREPAAWSRAGSGTLAVTDAGLRLVVDQGWCAGVVEPVILPRDAGKVRLSIRLGGGGRLIMQVAGDLHTDGKQRMFSPAWGSAMEATYERPLDPRAVKPAGGKPLKVVVSIEGPKGAWGEVSALDFLPMPRPAPTRIAARAPPDPGIIMKARSRSRSDVSPGIGFSTSTAPASRPCPSGPCPSRVAGVESSGIALFTRSDAPSRTMRCSAAFRSRPEPGAVGVAVRGAAPETIVMSSRLSRSDRGGRALVRIQPRWSR